jgi:hypothetical protein
MTEKLAAAGQIPKRHKRQLLINVLSKSRLSAPGPIADVRVLQVKQVQQVNANGQFVLFSIPAILTSVVVVGRFELPLIDGTPAKFKSD